MDAMTYWKAAGRNTVLQLCNKAGTSYGYWKQFCNRRKRPGVDLARRLVAASAELTPKMVLSLDALLIPKDAIRKPGDK
jgi:hypothetical protein